MLNDRWTEVEQLYHAVWEHHPDDRTAFLNRICRDKELREEVQALLEYQGQGDELFEHPSCWSRVRLCIGTQLGSYRLEAVIGEGGMGVVYRAVDSKLNRPVAVKVLSHALADAGARRRFQGEAQMASSLNHPHILTVHDAGEFDSRQYLVTELVDGGTLRDWARAEQRSWRQIVELLAGVADGLASAHEAGILHRDIKPENILVTRSGYAKLADFGTAKLLGQTDRDPTRTVSGQHTMHGLVFGTIAYMSPEQASGKPIDARSDIFSFGLVLYEILSGHRAFEGSTDEQLLQKITNSPAEPLPKRFPAALRRIVEKALEKKPEDRYQTTRELVVDLRTLAHEPEKGRARPSLRRVVALGSLAVALLVLILFVRSKLPLAPTPLQYTQITNFTDSARAPALSRNGSLVTFIRGGGFFQSSGQIYVKSLPDGEAKQLTDQPDLKYGPVFTPDGSRVTYTLLTPDGSWDTWIVPVSGGKPILLLSNASGLNWLSERQVIFSEIEAGSGTHMGIVTSAEDRSNERPIYFPPHKRAMAHYSFPSPDRKWALVVEMDQTTSWLPCRLVSLESLRTRPVGPQGACIAAGWSPDGRWMYFNAEVAGAWHIWRQHFPPGSPEQVTFGPTEEEGLAVSPDGRSLISSVGVRRSTISMHTSRGDQSISSEAFAFAPKMSTDGKRIFYLLRQNPASLTSNSPATDRTSPFGVSGTLSSVELASGKTQPLLPGFSVSDYQLSKDGKRIVFTGQRNRESGIWLADLDRPSTPRLVTRDEGQLSFGHPGEIIFTGSEEKQNSLYRIKTDGSGRERISTTPILGQFGVSPDGEWVAALVPRSGQKSNWETVAFQTRGTGIRKLCAFFCMAQWSADGRYLYLSVDISPKSSRGRTFVLPLRPGRPFPDLPAGGITSLQDLLRLPNVQAIEQDEVSPGPDPSTYLFARHEFQANLFRIALPR